MFEIDIYFPEVSLIISLVLVVFGFLLAVSREVYVQYQIDRSNYNLLVDFIHDQAIQSRKFFEHYTELKEILIEDRIDSSILLRIFRDEYSIFDSIPLYELRRLLSKRIINSKGIAFKDLVRNVESLRKSEKFVVEAYRSYLQKQSDIASSIVSEHSEMVDLLIKSNDDFSKRLLTLCYKMRKDNDGQRSLSISNINEKVLIPAEELIKKQEYIENETFSLLWTSLNRQKSLFFELKRQQKNLNQVLFDSDAKGMIPGIEESILYLEQF